MTRFAKEMKKRFPYAFCEDPYTGEKSGYVIEEEALVVFCHPSMTIVLRFLRDGKNIEVSDEYPRLSAPYLVYLCGGNEAEATRILKENHL